MVSKISLSKYLDSRRYNLTQVTETYRDELDIPQFSYSLTYRSGQKIIKGTNYTLINIRDLKTLFKMPGAHCRKQTEKWYLHGDSALLSSDRNILFKDDQSTIAINTENYNWKKTIFL
jgi:hypothetical protein